MVPVGIRLDRQRLLEKTDCLGGVVLLQSDLSESEPGGRQSRVPLDRDGKPMLSLRQVPGPLIRVPGEVLQLANWLSI